jgi:hypothetical protein
MVEKTKSRGRPQSFPGQETVAVLVHIPKTSRANLREVAKKRNEPINVTINRFIERGYKDATR